MKKIVIVLIACMFIVSVLPGIVAEKEAVEDTLKLRKYKEDRNIVPILTKNGVVKAPAGKGKPTYYVTITSPADGDEVSGTVTITLDSNSNPYIYIDGVWVGKGSSYSWDTTTYSNEDHIIHAEAKGAEDDVLVTVNNGGGGNTVPSVTITNPNNGATVSGTVSITAEAFDAEDGVLSADIYIDGALKGANLYSWDTTSYSDGAHTIYAKATDSGSLYGDDEITVSVSNGGGDVDKYALVIGISDYEGTANDLNYCDDDADDWAAFLNLQGYQVTKLVDQQATADNIEAAIIQLLQNEDGDDYVAVTYSGHGYDYPGYGSCIISQDLTYITHGYFESAFDNADSQHIYFTFDACEIGGFNGLIDSNRVGAFASNRRYSYDGIGDMNNGVFTYYEIEGWDDKNFDNFEDDGNYAVTEFKAWAKAYRLRVDPFVTDAYTGSMMP